ncbi:MAG: class I SAM-dependent methyltransferase [Armatimonadota bacterium]|nr:class I SAM-dependent methyltransferase [Armatimonadota bacterium]
MTVIPMRVVGQIHSKYVHNRRVRILSAYLSLLAPPGASILDVGCGDGLLSHLIRQHRDDVNIEGIDVLVRDQTHIPVRQFDGHILPYQDASFDVVMLVDVLHHTDNPLALLKEARRVARQAILIKDHTRNGFLAGPTLRFMDTIGNARYSVALPYTYWSQQQWDQAFQELNLAVDTWHKDLRLYPVPAHWIFDRDLHFVARINKRTDQKVGN